MVGLDPESIIAELFRQGEQPSAQPLRGLGLTAPGAEHPLAPERRKNLGSLAKGVAQGLCSRIGVQNFGGTKAAHRDESGANRSEEHTSELQSHVNLVC